MNSLLESLYNGNRRFGIDVIEKKLKNDNIPTIWFEAYES